MAITYTLSIENRVGTGMDVTERAVMVEGSDGFKTVSIYNPNANPKPISSDDTVFDTPFSITHPLRDVAYSLVRYNILSENQDPPKVKYDFSVDDARQKLFENILAQELLKKQPTTYPGMTNIAELLIA